MSKKTCRSIDFLNVEDPDPEMVSIKTHIIEVRNQEEIETILGEAGIQRGSRKWRDYSKAKKLIFKGLWIDSEIYDKQIIWITEYLNL